MMTNKDLFSLSLSFSSPFFLASEIYQKDKFGGYATFVASICGIGFLTAVIGDVASHFGCVTLIKESVTAITIVALGTSVPGSNNNKY